ncbi:hypothetical protein GCK32_004332 [Trichostrongylus colubriformis]|uniref:Uncharacterized protein n=1 Tax=Trichostrongylus colubriformis TaxID=6319 RepID=A0AAN8GAB5_TRICO
MHAQKIMNLNTEKLILELAEGKIGLLSKKIGLFGMSTSISLWWNSSDRETRWLPYKKGERKTKGLLAR